MGNLGVITGPSRPPRPDIGSGDMPPRINIGPIPRPAARPQASFASKLSCRKPISPPVATLISEPFFDGWMGVLDLPIFMWGKGLNAAVFWACWPLAALSAEPGKGCWGIVRLRTIESLWTFGSDGLSAADRKEEGSKVPGGEACWSAILTDVSTAFAAPGSIARPVGVAEPEVGITDPLP